MRRGLGTMLLLLASCAGTVAPRDEEARVKDEAVVKVDEPVVTEEAAVGEAAAEVAAAEVAVAEVAVAEAGVTGSRDLSGPALLGARRAAIEAAIGGPQGSRDGWVEYAGVELRYDGARCVGVRRTVPAGQSCEAAARWIGYPDAGAPLRRADRCEWPGISLRHRLAAGVAGTLVLAGGQFELRLL